LLWTHFPGFEEAFHAILPSAPNWEGELDELVVRHAATERDDDKRVYGVTTMFLERIKVAKKSDERFDFFILVVPDIIYENCKPLSRVQDGHGYRPTKAERELRTQMYDLFDTYDPEQYSYSKDFRRQIKARVMDLEIPIQIIRESTLRLQGIDRRINSRQLTPLSDRAWNLSTTLYYKAGRKPWKLSGVRNGVCYIGVSFKNTEDNRNACCAAQMFLNDGDGVVFLGDEGRWYSDKKGEYHLNKMSAQRLLSVRS